ncbi:MAG TPA: precorrin-2 C(20)-methyltransferase [Bacillota bacterium]|nr:precorrin-2 C(20)-methyltransferase [Bacillota bacterium]
MKGTLYGLGVGPGDPELLTLKAHRILQEADIICVPVSKIEKESLALSIVSPYIEADKTILELHMPMTQDEATLRACWDQGAVQMLPHLQAGKNVAFLTLGDPSLFSTYTYLMGRIMALDAEIRVETVPGITSLAAAAARLNRPLAEGEETLTIVPGLRQVEDLRGLLKENENVVLMKVSRQFPEIVRILEEENRVEQAVMVTRCGQAAEKITYDLPRVKEDKIDYMSVIIVKRGC